MEIAKAGWLYRQSSVLHRWKKHWFVLYQNGDLKYFEGPDSYQYEDRLVVHAICTGIRFGTGCNFSAPDGKSKESLLCLILRDGELRLCAESPDDMKAWHIAFEEARVMNRGNTTPMVTTGVYGPPGSQVMYTNTIHNAYPGGYVTASQGSYVVPNAASPGSAIVVGNTPGQVVHHYHERRGPYHRGGMVCAPLLWW